MKQCENCFFYRGKMNGDIVDLGNETIKPEDVHLCPMYEETIPDDIFNGNKACDMRLDRKEVESSKPVTKAKTFNEIMNEK